MKPFISWEETVNSQQDKAPNYRLLTADNGCQAGMCSGITVYSSYEYKKPGVHEDQEGFFVLEGEGFAKLGDEEFAIKKGDSFVAGVGVPHAVKTKEGCEPVKVFWFHSAV